MTITALPTAPSRTQDQDTFDTNTDNWIAAMPTFIAEANALAAAMNLNSTTDTSVSSVLIGTGSKSFTVSTAKSFQPGMYLVIADSAAPSTNLMVAIVTSYNSGTGALVVNCKYFIGSGTLSSWVISQTAAFQDLSALVSRVSIEATDNTNAALTVTQLGTGNTVYFGDSTSPDVTPFVIDQSGKVIVGHTAAVDIAGIGSGMQNHITAGQSQFRWTNDVNGTYKYHVKSRSATIGAFSIVSAGDVINYSRYYADDGTAFVEASLVSFNIEGTPSVGNVGAKAVWTQRNTAGTQYVAMSLSRDGALSVLGTIGYAVGSGGTVTQATSKATGVTLSKSTGDITMNNAALAAGAIVSFVLTNTLIAATDYLDIQHISGGTLGEYHMQATCAAGSATIYVKNTSAGSLSEAIVLKFYLNKAVIT